MATLTVTPDKEHGRMTITVAGSGISALTLWREVPGKVAERVQYWESAPLTASGGTLWDYEMPLQKDFKYYAVTTETGGSVTSPKVSAYMDDDRDWLKNPAQPGLNMPIYVQSLPQLTFGMESATQWVQSRQDPVVISGVRRYPTGELSIVTLEADDRGDVGALLGSSSVLLLSTPPDHGVGNAYLSIGDVAQNRTSVYATEQSRVWSMPVTQVLRPESDYSDAGDIVTYASAAQTFGT